MNVRDIDIYDRNGTLVTVFPSTPEDYRLWNWVCHECGAWGMVHYSSVSECVKAATEHPTDDH